MRHSLLSSVMEVVQRNYQLAKRLTIFEIGPVFLPADGEVLPREPRRLSVALSGQRQLPDWASSDDALLDFFDLKGIIEALLSALHIADVTYQPGDDPVFHPGKCARVMAGKTHLGNFGELHPVVMDQLDLNGPPILAAELDFESLLSCVEGHYTMQPVPAFPPVLEDIAIIVEEPTPAGDIESAIRQAGGSLLVDVRLFDIYRGEQIGAGNKSLAYSLTYQAADRTLTDKDATQIRQRIVRRLEQAFSARLRSV